MMIELLIVAFCLMILLEDDLFCWPTDWGSDAIRWLRERGARWLVTPFLILYSAIIGLLLLTVLAALLLF